MNFETGADFRIVQLPAKMIISKAFWSRMDHSASRMTREARSTVHALEGG
jgi:hypothetical protein